MGGVERKIDGMVVVVGRCTGDVVFACSFVRSFVRVPVLLETNELTMTTNTRW